MAVETTASAAQVFPTEQTPSPDERPWPSPGAGSFLARPNLKTLAERYSNLQTTITELDHGLSGAESDQVAEQRNKAVAERNAIVVLFRQCVLTVRLTDASKESSGVAAQLEDLFVQGMIRHSLGKQDESPEALYETAAQLLSKSQLKPTKDKDEFIRNFLDSGKYAAVFIYLDLAIAMPEMAQQLALERAEFNMGNITDKDASEFPHSTTQHYKSFLDTFPFLSLQVQDRILADASLQVSEQTGKSVKLTTQEFFKHVRLDAKNRGLDL